jgi:hypothetical protein
MSTSSPLYNCAIFLLTCKDPAGKPFESAQNVAEQAWIKEVEDSVVAGFASALFRKFIGGLLFEWTQKNVPAEREAGFQQAVLKIVKAQGGAVAEYWFGPSAATDTAVVNTPLTLEQRVELLRFLVGQVQANRLLEFRVFENADFATDVTEIQVADDAKAAEILLCDICGAKDLNQAAKIVNDLANKYSNNNSMIFHPVFSKDQLSTQLSKEDWELLEELNQTLMKEYAERRRAARSRFAQTLLSMSTSTSASLDKVELRRRGDSELALLGETPNVGTAKSELSSMRRVELLELVGSARNKKQATNFTLRNKIIPEVPDRGGRVNTHNFDRKVEVATHKADMAMKGKSVLETKQKQTAAQSMHVDAANGVGFMSSPSQSSAGMGSRSNTNASNSGAQATQAADQVRSRGGGRWSSDRNNSNNNNNRRS